LVIIRILPLSFRRLLYHMVQNYTSDSVYLLSEGLADTFTDLREVRLCRSCIRLNCDNTEEHKYFYMDYVLKCTSTNIDWKGENHSYECATLSTGKEFAFLIKCEGSLPWSQGGPPLDPQTEPDRSSPHPYTLSL